MLVDMLDDALMHQQDMWSPGHIRMDSHGENEFICMLSDQIFANSGKVWLLVVDIPTVLSIEIVKMIFPNVLNVSNEYKSVLEALGSPCVLGPWEFLTSG